MPLFGRRTKEVEKEPLGGSKKEEIPIETKERKIKEVREKSKGTTGEKKVEKGKFEELLEFARREKGEEKVEEKTIERRGVIDFEKVKKIPERFEDWGKEDLEKLQRNCARMSGYVEYQLIKHPELKKVLQESKSAKERQEKIVPRWNELGLEKIDPELIGEKETFSYQLFDRINLRALYLETGGGEGKFVLNPKQEAGSFDVGTPLVSETEDYLPGLEENIKRKMNEVRRSIKDKGKLERVLEDCKEGANLHIGTFGKAALKEKDLIPAIDAFDYTNELENPEIVTEFKKQMIELKKSEKPEDRESLMKVSEKLVEISEKERAEGIGEEGTEEELEEARGELEKATEEEK